MLLLLLAACSGGDEVSQAVEQSVSDEDRDTVIETSHNRWRISSSPRSEAIGAFGMEERSDLIEAHVDWQPDSGFAIQPLIQTREDLLGLGFGEPQAVSLNSLRSQTFQVVPGVPDDPRFDDPKFQPVKDAFPQECVNHATDYAGALFDLVGSSDLEELLNPSAVNASDSYEKSCLVQINAVPPAIRSVVGVLAKQRGSFWATFCSATIVGPRDLATSRHCFFEADSGDPLPEWQDLLNGSIGFYPLEAHRGFQAFSVRAVEPDAEHTEPFLPFEDLFRLTVLEGPFESQARIAGQALTQATVPTATWVVGSNGLLGDVTKQKDPLLLVRAASPLACAVLEVTPAGCLYHSCQAGGSTSGAGLLALSDTGLTLLGVHKGPLARAGHCEATPPLSLDLNVAAQLRAESIGG